ncbi:MAG: redox-regulated ATPase YchF [Candidatus Vogelbacteria bacterium CG10_big_fil_rev_8_21_14_0_10_45_14]|uniref:Redox-regulated ATPase YchF n=1 Tax=Candidatus Vogelbacteria bacterium CG10_big_fil_rev_8_21_14_0_10_45_14 TaxID=1975042 RepID=A0A2H0RN21_9BACT|nr:MAG: redox-regulated ATPase YchF [Candidatus Vogelbacteria bacterium CG10_big_fil_rev_8_21_14_0_10_45_14]
MKLSIGIVGLPNVGKSTLFNALTKKCVPAENYPFCTIDPSVGVVPVPDGRVDRLSELSKSKKKIPAVIEFVDIAGLVAGASKGEGLGNAFLSHIRETDAIAHVVRSFIDKDITHVSGTVSPQNDAEVIELELILADMQTVEKRTASNERDAKRGNKEAVARQELLLELKKLLEDGKPARSLVLGKDDETSVRFMKELNLLSAKPLLYVINTSEACDNAEVSFPGMTVKIDPVFEAGLDTLIKKSYELLGLITFFTTGEDETRAWTIKKESTAPLAGSAIHTDFKDKFIRAQVISSDDLLRTGSYAKAREQGLVRTEGKEYVVQDGDVIEFLI